MVGLGPLEALFCLIVFGVLLAGVGVLVALVVIAGRSKAPPAPAEAPRQANPQQAAAPIAADSHIEVVARLTQRFCPQCRSPLAADSPEGLCPACLMAGAIASQPPLPLGEDRGEGLGEPDNGLAVTTPPSGSKPPLVGEIGDLQQHFPNLEILELLGRGGMGAVYKVRQKNLDRMVALKVIPPDAAKDPAFAERFGREARAMARLNHPNIVTVYDFGQIGDLYYLLMEYVDGVNLRQTLRAGRLAPREAVAIVPPICDALQYAHDQGVVHRDIKPENVLLDRSGRVKIADFGLAKLLGKGPDDFTLTRTQQIMGTPRYMAPEQIERPTTVDHRADIYSLGVVLYEMLTGELPLGRFEPPSHKVQVDVRIDQVVLRALEKSPERRYQRASEIKTELASATSGPDHAAALASESPRPATPAWHTPSPARKDQPTEYPSSLGGPPLGMVLAVAFGMVLGVLMMAAGLAGGIYALTWGFQGFSGPFWGWMGGAFGCVVGGAGSAIGSYNTYRQMAGAEDLMVSPRTTWFDWVMRVYLAIGLVVLMGGAGLSDGANDWEPLVTLGAIATFQAGLFLILRLLMRRPIDAQINREREARPAKPVDPARETVRRRVAGPAIGLIVAGLIGLLQVVFLVLAIAASVSHDSGEILTPSQAEKAVVPLPPPGLILHAGGHASLPIVLAAESLEWVDEVAPPRAVPTVMWGIIGLLVLLLTLAPSLTLIVGGWRMRQGKSYGLSMVAAIIALLPCSFGWIVGLPMGIWALIVLLDPEVREGFEG